MAIPSGYTSAQVVQAVPVGGGMTLISTTTLTGASVSLSSIPQTYKNLQLIVRNFLPATDGTQFCVRVNNDSNANRHRSVQSATAAGVATFNKTLWNNAAIEQDNAVTQSIIVWDIFDYTNTTTWKTARTQFAYNNLTTTTSVDSEFSTHFYNQIDAITSLTLLCGSGNFTSGTVLFYGIF